MSYTVALPDQVKPFSDIFLLALCIFREARGEDYPTKVAVGWVVKNRVLHPSWYGADYFTVITKPFQFSSFNRGEVNSIVFGDPSDMAWKECVHAAVNVIQSNEPDPTGGACYYFDKSLDPHPPKWAALYRHTADIGAMHFYIPPSA